MPRKKYFGVRIAAVLGLSACLVMAIMKDGFSATIAVFCVAMPAWFVFSLLIEFLVSVDPKGHMMRNTVFGMIDAYLIITLIHHTTNNLVLAVSFLGIYILSSTAISGKLTGISAAIAATLATLAPGFDLKRLSLIAATGAVTAAFGAAIQTLAPLLQVAINEHEPDADANADTDAASAVPDNPSTVKDLQSKLQAMQQRLEKVSEERNVAQELTSELEKKVANSDQSKPAKDNKTEDAGGLAEQLEIAQAELKKATHENVLLKEELDDVAKELTTTYENALKRENAALDNASSPDASTTDSENDKAPQEEAVKATPDEIPGETLEETKKTEHEEASVTDDAKETTTSEKTENTEEETSTVEPKTEEVAAEWPEPANTEENAKEEKSTDRDPEEQAIADAFAQIAATKANESTKDIPGEEKTT